MNVSLLTSLLQHAAGSHFQIQVPDAGHTSLCCNDRHLLHHQSGEWVSEWVLSLLGFHRRILTISVQIYVLYLFYNHLWIYITIFRKLLQIIEWTWSFIFFSVAVWAQYNIFSWALGLLKCLFFCVAPGEWRPLVLGRAHSAGEQCILHWRLRNVEPVCLRHHVPLCTVSQALWRWTLKCTVHHW